MEYVLIFENTNMVMKAERCLLAKKLNVNALPLPNEISAGCGICLRIGPEDLEVALGALTESGVTDTTVYWKREVDGKIEYEEREGC
jgi:hypothetical protein